MLEAVKQRVDEAGGLSCEQAYPDVIGLDCRWVREKRMVFCSAEQLLWTSALCSS